MAWRFKASKYKNAAPVVPKPEACVRDICVGSYQTYGNNIAASASFMAFNWDHVGSSLAVLPLDDCGRKSKTIPLLHAHSDTVTDLDFSPFHDGLLATGSQDCLVKVWCIPKNGLTESLTKSECTFMHKQRRVETVKFHPTADGLLSTTSFTTLSIWDVLAQQEMFSNNCDHSEVIQSLSWKRDGSTLVTSCKDKQLRIIDPRAKTYVTHVCNSHASIKDSRVVWMNDNKLLTTGFDAARLRQVIIRDVRNLNAPEKTLELDCSTGILIPLFDFDTNMLFLAGKGDSTIAYMEVVDREPYLIEGLRHSGEQTKGACLVPKRALNVMQGEVNRLLQLTSSSIIPIMYQVPRKSYRDFHADLYPDTVGCATTLSAQDWINGANTVLAKITLDPQKRENGESPIKIHRGALDDMKVEIAARKPTPPRLGPKPFTPPKFSDGSDAQEKSTNNAQVISHVDSPNEPDQAKPVKNHPPVTPANSLVEPDSPLKIDNGEDKAFERASFKRSSIADRRRMYESNLTSTDGAATINTSPSPIKLERNASTNNVIVEGVHASPTPLRRRSSLNHKSDTNDENGKNDAVMKRQQSYDPQATKKMTDNVTPSVKRTSTVFGRVSKFRHLQGTPAHKSFHIENIRNISRQVPGECDGFHANADRVAVPLSGAGGRIAIFELKNSGKLPDGVIPALVHGNNIMDFQWDPFNNQRLAVACDDGIIRLWIVPENGLQEPTNTPATEINAHPDKIYFIKFHPLAKDVLASASYDMTVKIWDLTTFEERIVLSGHTDQIFSFAWSPMGALCATVTKGKIRVYDPRVQSTPIHEGIGPVGARGARIVWALDGNFLVVTGFDKVSERQIIVFKASDLKAPLNSIGLDVSPAILIPFYDNDSSTLFLTGKGDSTIYAFEITEEAPFICPLSHHRCTTLHQGLSFLAKNACDVANVEFAKAYRLTNNSIEPLSFTVPRIKSDVFQDDLFPPTICTWKWTVTSAEWFAGKPFKVARVSLKPDGMQSLSDLDAPTKVVTKKVDVEESNGHVPNFLANMAYPDQSSQSKIKQIQKSLSSRLEVNLKLEQDDMDGVDAEEWAEAE